MDREDLLLQFETRRHFFSRCGVGLGKVALASLLTDGRISPGRPAPANSDAGQAGHFPAKAKSVIYLFMAGAPSQFELVRFQAEAAEVQQPAVPDSLMAGKRFAFMDSFAKEKPKLLGTSAHVQAARPAAAPGYRTCCRTSPASPMTSRS